MPPWRHKTRGLSGHGSNATIISLGESFVGRHASHKGAQNQYLVAVDGSRSFRLNTLIENERVYRPLNAPSQLERLCAHFRPGDEKWLREFGQGDK
jgi:hypothetical protein